MSKDKRIPLSKAIELTHEAYDRLEVISIEAASRALKVEFGFGDIRLERFKKAYLEFFGEEAAAYAIKTRAKLRRNL